MATADPHDPIHPHDPIPARTLILEEPFDLLL